LFDLAPWPNLYLKLTSRTVDQASEGASTSTAFFPKLVAAFGAERIAWGSNFPAHEGPLSRLTQEARQALSCLSEADQASIFSGTAAKLYPALTH
jgi:predicted TIM-barrel fold metal-dependent hydrolase